MNTSRLNQDIFKSFLKPEASETPKIKSISSDTIEKTVAIMSLAVIDSNEANELWDIVRNNTHHYNSLIDLRKDGIYILISNFLERCPKDTKNILLHTLIQRALEFPFAAISLLDEAKAFNIEGLKEISSIKDSLKIVEESTNRNRKKT